MSVKRMHGRMDEAWGVVGALVVGIFLFWAQTAPAQEKGFTI
jgi:hypothetical protein